MKTPSLDALKNRIPEDGIKMPTVGKAIGKIVKYTVGAAILTNTYNAGTEPYNKLGFDGADEDRVSLSTQGQIKEKMRTLVQKCNSETEAASLQKKGIADELGISKSRVNALESEQHQAADELAKLVRKGLEDPNAQVKNYCGSKPDEVNVTTTEGLPMVVTPEDGLENDKDLYDYIAWGFHNARVPYTRYNIPWVINKTTDIVNSATVSTRKNTLGKLPWVGEKFQ